MNIYVTFPKSYETAGLKILHRLKDRTTSHA